MMPSDMNLKIKTGTVGYSNKILISDGKFSVGKNEKVNALEPVATPAPKISHKVVAQTTIAHGLAIIHKEEKAALILFLTGGFTMWFMFR